MKFKVKDMDISTGGILVALINKDDAAKKDLHHGDRIRVQHNRHKILAILDIAESGTIVEKGQIGLFEECLSSLKVKNGSEVTLKLAEKPKSVYYIRQKLRGSELKPEEIEMIIQDVVDKRITEVELTYFISGTFVHGMTLKETVALTKSIIDTGETLVLDKRKRPIIDKHCIGGVAGNRTTLIVVPMLIAAGLTVPKTSSRAITSPAGTADTMEVLAHVTLPMKKIKQVVNKTGGCMVWGGGVNLAPADDAIIKVEYPLSIDAECQMLASVLAKKGSVNATHVQIDIPVGLGAKIDNMKDANHLKKQFVKVGKQLGMQIHAIITDGSQPIGNGIGPALEARDVLWVLMGDERAPKDLRDKCIMMAVKAMRFSGKSKKNVNYKNYFSEMLDSGVAYKKMVQIIKAQGAKITHPDDIPLGEYSFKYHAPKTGTIRRINSKTMSKIARLAGAPKDKEGGLFLFKHVGDKVKKGEYLFKIYAKTPTKLRYSKEFLKTLDGFEIN